MRSLNNFRTPPAFLGVALLAIVGLIVLLLTPPAQPPPLKAGVPPNPFENPKAGKAHIQALADQYGNDFDRLNDDDKVFLNAIAMGHGRELLAKTARENISGSHRNPDAAAGK